MNKRGKKSMPDRRRHMNKDMWHEQVRVLRRVRNLIGRDKGTR